MYQQILVPLDGSARAERAVPVAAHVARASGGRVVFPRAAGLPTAFVPHPSADPWTIQKIIDADVAEAKDYLQYVAHLDDLLGVQVETEVIVGAVATTILSVAEAGGFDLLVLCSHGSSGMRRWLLGSVAEHVARHTPVPLLLLREGGPALVSTPPGVEGPLRALISLDGSAHAEAALLPTTRPIAALAAPEPAALHLSRVIAQFALTESGQREWEELLREARRYLSATAEHLREELVESEPFTDKLAITWSVTWDEDIATGILRVAESGEATEEIDPSRRPNVIAIATHGYSGIQRWAMGSIPSESCMPASFLSSLYGQQRCSTRAVNSRNKRA